MGRPGNRSATARGQARSSFAAVNSKGVLKIPQLSVGPAVIAERRAAGLDGFLEHGANRGREGLGFTGRTAPGVGENVGWPLRRKMRTK